jgi:hypothetical protein
MYSIHIWRTLYIYGELFRIFAFWRARTRAAKASARPPVCVRARVCVHVLEPRKPLLAHLYLYLSVYPIMYVCLSVYFLSIHLRVHANGDDHDLSLCLSLPPSLDVCVYIYVYMYIYIDTHIHIYVYIYIHLERERERERYDIYISIHRKSNRLGGCSR